MTIAFLTQDVLIDQYMRESTPYPFWDTQPGVEARMDVADYGGTVFVGLTWGLMIPEVYDTREVDAAAQHIIRKLYPRLGAVLHCPYPEGSLMDVWRWDGAKLATNQFDRRTLYPLGPGGNRLECYSFAPSEPGMIQWAMSFYRDWHAYMVGAGPIDEALAQRAAIPYHPVEKWIA